MKDRATTSSHAEAAAVAAAPRGAPPTIRLNLILPIPPP
jgi:hypothetical protein